MYVLIFIIYLYILIVVILLLSLLFHDYFYYDYSFDFITKNKFSGKYDSVYLLLFPFDIYITLLILSQLFVEFVY